MPLTYRLTQVLDYLRAERDDPPVIPPDAAAVLNEPMLHQFRILQTGDQRHLLRVHRYLVSHAADPDTVVAGLLHDVGKGCMKCRITVIDRAVHVLLSTWARPAYMRWARSDSPSERFRSLHRLANHPARGALAALQAGYNPRISELIRHHERGGDPTDTQLALLREADRMADARWNKARP